MKDNFDSYVNDNIKHYNTLNNIIFALVVVGSYFIAGDLATYATGDPTSVFASANTETDYIALFIVFLGLVLTYSLFYVFIRVTIKSYGEKIRANQMNIIIYNQLVSLSKKE